MCFFFAKTWVLEFDPKENIDRSEDDNDPQDKDSLAGEGGLFGRVPGGPRFGAANRSQGQAHGSPGPDQGQPLGGQGHPLGGKGQDQGLPLGDQCPLLGRQGQAQDHGGLGQAQGGQALGRAGQAKGLLGMLGGIPFHVSVAASAVSASMMPTSGYFGTFKSQAVEINACWVICPKHARGAHSSRDFARHQEAGTKDLPYPFASAKHFHA